MAEPKSPRAEAVKKELARKANDTIRVRNITDEAFMAQWDGYQFNVPSGKEDIGHGKGEQLLPRYIALNYVKHMTDKILTQTADEHVAKINAKRKTRGQPSLNPQEREVEETPFRTDNAEKREPIIRQLWVGVEKEFGLEAVPERPTKTTDRRPIEERVIESIERGEVRKEPEPELEGLEEKKEAQMKELSE